MIGSLATVRTQLANSHLAQRFLNGAAWSVLGAVGSSGVALIMWLFVARLLGKETYGQFVVIQSTLNMVGVFAGFGIGAAATRYAAELKARDTTQLGHILTLAERTILVFGLVATATLIFFSGWLSSYVLNEPGLTIPLAIAAVAVLFTALDGYQKSVLIGFESMRAFAIGVLAAAILGLPIMLMAAYNYGLRGAAVALITNAFIQMAVSRYQMAGVLKKAGVQRNADGCLEEWQVLWHFALPALLSGALVGPAHWIAQALLAKTSNGYAELAVLGIAMQWFNLIGFLPGVAGRVVLPMLTEHVAKGDHDSSRKILLLSMGANAIATIPLAGAIAFFSPYIMSKYGNGFERDYVPMSIAVMIAALLSIQTPVGNMLAAKSRMWLAALMNAGWAIIYVGLAHFLNSKGALGIILALGVAYIAHASWTFWFAFQDTNYHFKKYA